MRLDITDSADFAESIVEEAKTLLSNKGITIPDRVMTSLQDVIFWMLMTEATR